MTLVAKKGGELSLDTDVSGHKHKKKQGNKGKQPPKMVDTEDGDDKSDSYDRGVVYLSHIPHGFYEPQMRHFFGQFGRVTRLKLFRSKKSGQSRGFAYIEFEYEDIAKIVADTMNNYLMFKKLLKCHFIPKDKLCAAAFTNANRPFVKPYHRQASAKRHNSLLQADTDHIIKNQKRLVKQEGKRRKKMEALGIECSLPGYTEEWQHIKQAHAVVSEGRKLKALKRKEMELRKQEALKRAKQRVKLHSKRRQERRRLREEAEREDVKQDNPESSPDAVAQEGRTQGDGGKSPKGRSPKQKSLDTQSLLVSSSSEMEGQPRKKKGRVSAPGSSAQDVSSSASPPKSKKDSEGMLSSVRKSKKSGRFSLKDAEKLRATPPAAKATPETAGLTRSAAKASSIKRVPPTPKSAAKKGNDSPSDAATPKLPAQRKKELKTPRKTPRSERKAKSPQMKASSDEVESGESPSEEESKIKEFTGIKLPASGKKTGAKGKKSVKKPTEVKIAGDQLVIF